MKRYFVLIFTLLFLGCSTEEMPSALSIELEQPQTVTISCLDAPDEYNIRIEYSFDDGKVVSEKRFAGGVLDQTTTYDYDADTLLVSEVIISGQFKVTKSYSYNSNKQLTDILWKTIQYDGEGNVVSDEEVSTPLEYEDGLLVKEQQNWGGFITYEYQNGKISVMTEHTSYGDRHHITYYNYASELLTEERKETVGGTIMYIRKYQYDSRNRLESVTEDGKVVEEYTYAGNRITEKIVRYYGIDPGIIRATGITNTPMNTNPFAEHFVD